MGPVWSPWKHCKTTRGGMRKEESTYGPRASGAVRELPRGKREESVQDFIAYLYSVIRDDEGMVQAVDRALKERYGSVQRIPTD